MLKICFPSSKSFLQSLDNSKHDIQVYESFNDSDDKTDSEPHGSMGRISLGAMFSEDSIGRGLGVSL